MIPWIDDLATALAQASETKRPVLVYLFSPTCAACVYFDTVTYAHEGVVRELNEHFIPCRIRGSKPHDPEAVLNVRWLPATVILDAKEKQLHVAVGVLSPEEWLLEARFGRAIAAMRDGRYDEAHALFQEVAAVEGAERAPEALFWWGISRFCQSRYVVGRSKEESLVLLSEIWRKVPAKWPSSQWARKIDLELATFPG